MTDRIQQAAQTTGEHSGMRLDQVAAELFPQFSRARLQAWAREGCLTVDGRTERPAYRLAGGETLVLDAMPEAQVEVSAQPLKIEVIHSDRSLLVVNKAAGMVVHPAAGNPDGTLQNALLYLDPELEKVPRAGIVHRLDKDTSGVMVVARTLQAHAALVRQLQDRSMSRRYETVVHGETPLNGTVEAAIGRHPRQRQKMAVVTRGKPAVSHFRVIERFVHFSHLAVSLESGRTHQIRVHLQHLGFPLVGDPVYGRKLSRKLDISAAARAAVEGFPRQALHARYLELAHPESERRMQFEAPLPGDLEQLLETLRHEDSGLDPAPG
jgi:23S rRNA pseudouridine1911/1915/1917 synthase